MSANIAIDAISVTADSGEVIRHGHGQYALASPELLPLPEVGREIVAVLAQAGVEAHLTAFDVLARFAHQLVYAFPHVLYAEPYAVSDATRALADAGFIIVRAGRHAGVDLLRETRRSCLPLDLGEVGRILHAMRSSGCDEDRLRRYAQRMRYDAWLAAIEQPEADDENPEIAALRSGYREPCAQPRRGLR